MDEVYRFYRIAIKRNGIWMARITHVRGTYVPFSASATLAEGPDRCLARARELVDKYIDFLSANGVDGEPN